MTSRLLLPVAIAFLAHALAAQPAPAVTYEAFAVRFGTLPQFRVSGLIAGADASRRLDIPVMVWLLKGSNGRRVLIDSGFYRQKFLDQWKPQNFRSPADAVATAGVRPEEITDIVITHAHWDHVDGADLFPKATIWIQRDDTPTTPARLGTRETPTAVWIPTTWLALLKINTEGRLRFVNGDDQEILPGIRCYTGGKHTGSPSMSGCRRPGGTAVFTSDNVYLYENLEKRAPIAQTLDAASNLKAQDRIRALASSPVAHRPRSRSRRFREVRARRRWRGANQMSAGKFGR